MWIARAGVEWKTGNCEGGCKETFMEVEADAG